MGHMFSSHVPCFLTSEHTFPHGHLHDHDLNAYKGFEEDGDQKLWVEARCAETTECKQMRAEYESCVERIAGKEDEGKHCGYQYMNMWGCVDFCAAEPTFKLLKHGV
eukprot:TRINITY_DN880_c1_g2_i1.p1 TRINITY_DN880_c1_g2~~TRINITY_DN880_c1_g2_i1.p1  ORF type:complete len:117 (+),score=27.44 TRINITY_DN880_c1_g2_i1:31-351(+)